MQFVRQDLSDDFLIQLYQRLVKPRMIEEKMLKLLRQGKVSKWFSGIGQEAIAVGVTSALQSDEYIHPLHRNLGVFTTRDVPLERLFLQFQGKKGGFTNGRDRSFHFGTTEHHIAGMISHLGPQLCVADGVALAESLSRSGRVAATFTGDGGTSEGDFHEGLNIAAVWDLPVLFIIENNGYGLSTPISEQFRCKQLADKGDGYGMRSVTIDGNNILEVYHTIDRLAKEMRDNPHPVLVECMTFRMRGHEEASGTKYVPDELFEEWGKKDPVNNFESYLKDLGLIDDQAIEQIRKGVTDEINAALDHAFETPTIIADSTDELNDIYQGNTTIIQNPVGEEKEARFVDAVSEGLSESMKKHDNLVIMGQDVAEYGGVFKITDGFVEQFGKERVRNTPLCESGILSAGLGLSLRGYKSVIEMQFGDFVSSGFNAIVNNLAKVHYRWGQNADVVVRMPCGAGVGAGPFHSQSNEAWFVHTPGLKVVFPSTPADAKGLLLRSIEDPNPVMFFEHKALYRGLSGNVPEGYYTYELGVANTIKQGEDTSIITYGMGVHWAQKVVDELGLDVEIIDLRTLLPLDMDTVYSSVRKTGKVLVLHEDTLTGGVGGEIASLIGEHCFEHLDAPVVRVGGMDTPVPFAASLEEQFLANSRLKTKLEELIAF